MIYQGIDSAELCAEVDRQIGPMPDRDTDLAGYCRWQSWVFDLAADRHQARGDLRAATIAARLAERLRETAEDPA